MHERFTAGIVHEFTAHGDSVAGPDRNRRREVDVVDDFEREPVVGSTVERFVMCVADGSAEVARRRRHGGAEIDFDR